MTDAAAAGLARPDLDRRVYCLFGLVFDAVSLDEAAAHVARCAAARRRCFLSTPNVNFVVAAQADAAFRDSVLRSDLSVADGMPVVWAARLAGIPLPERVAGSNLFERLRVGTVPIKVYFFGGTEEAASRAAQALDAAAGVLRCVGHEAPGFGSVDDMSAPQRLARIDASGADFLVVAIGARKGQAWIERNRGRLAVPVIAYLGAVINFVAGDVARAPGWMQRLGLEWLWRVRQEPALWRRYLGDGWVLARLLLTGALPLAIERLLRRADDATASRIVCERTEGRTVLRLHGPWTAQRLEPLRRAIGDALDAGAMVQLDLRQVTVVDSAFVALTLVVDRWQGTPGLIVRGAAVAPAVARTFRRCGAQLPVDA